MKYSSSSSSSMAVLAAVLLVLAASSSQAASSCTFPTLTATYAAPSVAAGYTARLVATGLAAPRSLQWDDAGHLLVLEQGHGIRSLAFRDGGADCLQLSENRSIVADTKVHMPLPSPPFPYFAPPFLPFSLYVFTASILPVNTVYSD